MIYPTMKNQRKLKFTSLIERSQREKATYSMSPSKGYSGKGKIMETVKQSLITRHQWGKRDK